MHRLLNVRVLRENVSLKVQHVMSYDHTKLDLCDVSILFSFHQIPYLCVCNVMLYYASD